MNTLAGVFSKTHYLRCWLSLALFVSSIAPGAPREVEDWDNKARAHFAQATKAYNLGKFEEALKLYIEAYDAKPHPSFLFNIAQCYRQLGDYETAATYYRRYRNEGRLSASDARVVEQLIAEVEAKQVKRAQKPRRNSETARRPDLQTTPTAALEAGTKADEQQRTSLISPKANPPAPASDSIFKKWWFWAGVGGGLVAGAAIYAAVPAHSRNATLGSVSAR
jgi:tetratricopeptide (TPR) repeat protein